MCLEDMDSGIRGLEMPLHQFPQQRHLLHPLHHQQQQQIQQPQQQQHQSMLSFSAHNSQSTQQSITHNTNHPSHPSIRPNQQQQQQQSIQSIQSDEDETEEAKNRASPWQRMKWTDNMVRLLIMVVFYIEDDSHSRGDNVGLPNKAKKCGGAAGSSSNVQKKGKKWKSVSRAMMEKGFYVSPQQCEDKFNDLNKRYKRVNEILGKGVSCRVVENQSLLDTMDHLSQKSKDEVRKLLNSKHLFYKEMCAYHNSGAAESTHQHDNSENLKIGSNPEELKLRRADVGEEEDCEEDECDGNGEDSSGDDDEDEDVDVEDEEEQEEQSRGDGEDEKQRLIKKRRIDSISVKQMRIEMMGALENGSKSDWEKKEWVMTKLVRLEEERVRWEVEALEMEKQRLKWLKFSEKKEREMERLKIKNEKMKLENNKMVVLMRKKEIELLHLHHHQQQQQQQQSSSNNNISTKKSKLESMMGCVESIE